MADLAEAIRTQVYEVWEDSESLAQHSQYPYNDQMAELLQSGRIVRSTNRAYLIEREESVHTEKGEKKKFFLMAEMYVRLVKLIELGIGCTHVSMELPHGSAFEH